MRLGRTLLVLTLLALAVAWWKRPAPSAPNSEGYPVTVNPQAAEVFSAMAHNWGAVRDVPLELPAFEPKPNQQKKEIK